MYGRAGRSSKKTEGHICITFNPQKPQKLVGQPIVNVSKTGRASVPLVPLNVVCVGTPRMYPQSRYFLVRNKQMHTHSLDRQMDTHKLKLKYVLR